MRQRTSYFEGWYLKHQNRGNTLAVIPSFHVGEDGKSHASLQLITNESSWLIPLPAEQCRIARDRFCVIMGENRFSCNGARLSLEADGLSAHGHVHYGELTPPKGDVMGPFRHIPFLQCNHGVLSLFHPLSGQLTVNGMTMDFNKGTGYIEKDWGSSFPQSYLWTQCNFRHGASPCCVMAALADIPLLGSSFTGCICCVYIDGREYRLSTYKGVHILHYSEREVLLRQRSLFLHVQLIKDNPLPLQAPEQGVLARVIHESPACIVRYRFYEGQKLLFDVTSSKAGFEYVKF